MDNNTYELMCKFCSNKSFYGKAMVKEYEDNLVKTYKLYSYNTLVAIVSYDKLSSLVQYNYLGKFSCTSTRHQKEFFKQHGLNDNLIKDLFKKGYLEIFKGEC